MDKNQKQYYDYGRLEGLKLSMLFLIIAIIWIIFREFYLLNFNMGSLNRKQISFIADTIYLIINIILINIVISNRRKRNKASKSNLLNSLKETNRTKGEEGFCQITLEKQLSMIENLVKEINLGVIGWDKNLMITSINPYLLKVTQYNEKELIGKKITDLLLVEEEKDYILKSLNNIKDGGSLNNINMRIKGRFGQILDFATYNMLIKDSINEDTEILTFAIDRTEQNKMEKRLRHLAYYDDITGLPNKHFLRKYLDKKLMEKELRFAILYIEIDDYKIMNESSGHEEADSIIKKVSSILLYMKQNESDYLAKISENEFIMVVNDNINKKELGIKSREIIDSILSPIYINGSVINLTVKIGISIYPDISKFPEITLEESHLALHHIKYNPLKHYIFYDKKIGEKIKKENHIINELEKAIKNKDFTPYFQPISCIENNQIIGFETLIRWIHPEDGIISPAEFIPISEETGQIYKITDIILEKALMQKAIWNKQGFENLKITVNISSKSFEEGGLELKILGLLRKYDIQPNELILEITETASIKEENKDITLRTFNRFKGIGVEIALDDFGTGNSSLTRLNLLPIKYLKLDRSFVKNIVENQGEQEIVKTVVKLAHSLELIVIAEGIETKEQMEILNSFHCDLGQGYYLAKPEPAEKIEIYLNNNIKRLP